ncbi:O-antigen ligase family protein [Psychroflexus gondwanensis]|jgi:O-antigen ligase|uniref:O-antigen polymerase n=1 Tax=Psychroflexus gondwanensis ACAM 44 TaxID=1189619 RepID=N1WSS5_9FLAO|nr:O-antigen ligase family protein [Psychroflexus gondwanensis]EMY80189.1 O-antigen polymerase [Psychroflexus gondwanensis ACAM 44]TXE18493.1 O-antigen ligase family protein [Psychroflexus gondwanensis]
MNIKKLISKLANLLLILFVLFTVLPIKLNYSSLAIILLILLGIVNLFLKNGKSPHSKDFFIFIISIPLVVYIFGVLNTSNTNYALGFLGKNLSFIAFPIIFFSLGRYVNKSLILKLYLLGLFFTNLYLLYLFFYYFNFGLRFYKIVTLDIYHSTYLGMYNLLAYWICITLFMKKLNKLYFILAAFFLISAIVTSARIIFLIAIVSLLVTLFYFIRSKWKRIGAMLLIGVFCIIALLSIPSYTQKFNQFLELDKISFDKSNYRSLSSRFGKLEASIAVLKDNLWFGTGTGDAKDVLVEEYKKMNFTMGYKNKYNPHNQYLDNLTRNGIIGGLLCLLIIYGLPFYIGIKQNNLLFLAFVVIVSIVSLTESILDTHKGITFYTFFASLLLYFQLKKINHRIK